MVAQRSVMTSMTSDDKQLSLLSSTLPPPRSICHLSLSPLFSIRRSIADPCAASPSFVCVNEKYLSLTSDLLVHALAVFDLAEPDPVSV